MKINKGKLAIGIATSLSGVAAGIVVSEVTRQKGQKVPKFIWELGRTAVTVMTEIPLLLAGIKLMEYAFESDTEETEINEENSEDSMETNDVVSAEEDPFEDDNK